MELSQNLLELLNRPSTCYIATTMADGSPQLTQTWVDTDGEHILINSVQGFLKVRNIERDPRVAVAVSDPDNPRRYFQVRGRAHREAVPEVPRHALPLVRGPRSGARHHHHRAR